MGDKLIMSKKELRRKGILELVKEEMMNNAEASSRLGITPRHFRRIYHRYLQEGGAGLVHRSRGKASTRRTSEEMRSKIISLYRGPYEGYGPTLASEKLEEEDGIKIHKETLRLLLKEKGLWQPKRVRRQYRSRRPRRRRFGELLQMDGSIHQWLPHGSDKDCLMNLIDDATGKTMSFLDSGETVNATLH